jgi:hypothetical protein
MPLEIDISFGLVFGALMAPAIPMVLMGVLPDRYIFVVSLPTWLSHRPWAAPKHWLTPLGRRLRLCMILGWVALFATLIAAASIAGFSGECAQT